MRWMPLCAQPGDIGQEELFSRALFRVVQVIPDRPRKPEGPRLNSGGESAHPASGLVEDDFECPRGFFADILPGLSLLHGQQPAQIARVLICLQAVSELRMVDEALPEVPNELRPAGAMTGDELPQSLSPGAKHCIL